MVISLLHYDDDGKETLSQAITFYVVNITPSNVDIYYNWVTFINI